MRISDWSSDVCSSDLDEVAGVAAGVMLQVILVLGFGLPEIAGGGEFGHHLARPQTAGFDIGDGVLGDLPLHLAGVENCRSEGRRVGKEGVSQSKCRWSR